MEPVARSETAAIGAPAATPRHYRYHGFISYSHAADGALAPALQRGLQRFAKPWYRTRALSIFRDDTSLTATPHLWGSIQDALDDSEFFVLLASPDAAQSPWVAREAERWCETKPLENLLIGLTDGELAWDDAARDFAWSQTDSVPPVLRGVFKEEPRFVDLRWARNSDDLGLSHPRFRDAVADLAAPMHHRAKEELASEEVRQHRRTIRLARGAVVTLVLLTAAAIAAGVVALAARSTALLEKRDAESSSLSARSSAELSATFDRAGLLSIEAYRLDPTVSARSSVVTALEQPTTAILRGHVGPVNAVAFSAEGSEVASGGDDGTLRLWDVAARREIGAPLNLIGNTAGYGQSKSGSGQVLAVAFSGRGNLLAAASAIYRYTPGGVAVADRNATVNVWDTTGALRRIAAFAEPHVAVQRLVFSPDGRLLVLARDDGSLGLWDVAARAFVPSPGATATAPASPAVAFSPDGRTLAFASDKQVRFWDVAGGRQTGTPIAYAANGLAFDPANPGTLAAVGGDDSLTLWNVRRDAQLAFYTVGLQGGASDLAFSPDGGRIALAIPLPVPTPLIDVSAAGHLGPAEALAGAAGGVSHVAFNASSSEIATADADGTVRIFTVPGLSGLASPLPGSTFGSAAAVAGSTVVAVNATNGANPSDAVDLWNLKAHTRRSLPWTAYSSRVALSPDGRLVAVGGGDGNLRLLDAETGAQIGSAMPAVSGSNVQSIAFSPDGRLVAAAGDRAAWVYDVATQRPAGPGLPAGDLSSPVSDSNSTRTLAFSPDGRLLAVGDLAGQVRLWDVTRHRLAGRPIDTNSAPVRDIAFSPAGRIVAVAGAGTVGLWDVGSRRRTATLVTDASGGLWGVAFNPDGGTVATLADCALRLWDPATHAALGSPIDLSYVEARARGAANGCDTSGGSVAFSDDGSLVVNLGSGGPIYVWSPALTTTRRAVMERTMCAIVDRNLTRGEFSAALPGEPYHATCDG